MTRVVPALGLLLTPPQVGAQVAPAPAAQAREVASAGPVATTARFELWSQPRVGLHHFLLAWTLADADRWPPFAPPIVERDSWRHDLDEADARVWAAAVDAYGAARGRSLLFDEGMLAVRDWAAGAGDRNAIPEADRSLAEALESALPVYTRHWWPDHDRANRIWIEALVPALADVEEAVVVRLEAAYGGSWPTDRIPIDVVAYANPVGAYSTGGRVTIASGDPDIRMPQALETVFHEASHVDALEAPLRSAVGAAFGAAGGAAPGRLWHDLIFFTTGETLLRILADRGEPGYRHYGEVTGVYTRGERWAAELAGFRRHWQQFLAAARPDDEARRRALEALARELLDEERGSTAGGHEPR